MDFLGVCLTTIFNKSHAILYYIKKSHEMLNDTLIFEGWIGKSMKENSFNLSEALFRCFPEQPKKTMTSIRDTRSHRLC
jgi:hypothetical protein